MSRRHWARRILARLPPQAMRGNTPSERSEYEDWLKAHVSRRRRLVTPTAKLSVSIVTPVYDPPSAIFSETTASVLGQTWPLWEWIIVDNSSTDHPVRESLDALGRDSRVHVIRSETNLGIVGGMRRGLENARGD